ncbi:MAG: ABC transporter permease [Candidatus Lokiarchaeota archaeon]|nr:ABC transporter permease [Candidatus Lokiarchaeota archaeon]
MKSIETNILEEEDSQTKTSLIKQRTTTQKFISNSFLRLVVTKLIFYFIIFFIAISLAFLIPRLVPGNPLDYINQLGSTGLPPSYQEQIRTYMEQLFGLDQPIWVQYWRFLEAFFLHGDFGLSIDLDTPGQPVMDLILPTLPYTLMVAIPTLIITFFLGNLIGAWVGYNETKPRKVIYYIVLTMGAAPFYWFAYVLATIFITQLQLFPPLSTSVPNFAWDWAVLEQIFSHFWLPLILLIMVNTGGWSTGARSMMIYERGSGYILYSQKLGFKESKLRKYAYRNSLLPQFTGLNMNFNNIIGQTLILEVVLNWPGLGKVMIDAFSINDYAMIIGTFVIVIFIIVIGNFLIDISYGLLDPRIRIGGQEG